MLRVIIDNNLWVSFLIGKRMSALEHMFGSDDIAIYVCSELIDEFLSVTSRDKIRKYISDTDVQFVVRLMYDYCYQAEIASEAVSPIRDPKDLYLLSLAETVNADYILTGDKDLLVLGNHKSTRIRTLNDFMANRSL